MSIHFKVKLIRDPLALVSSTPLKASHHWLTDINGQVFDYYTDALHRSPLSFYDKRNRPDNSDLEYVLKNTNPISPVLDSVLHNIITEGQDTEQPFSSWCYYLGYSTDSKSALDTYILRQDYISRLNRVGVPVEDYIKRFNDY
jgi:hypothetical protein